MVGKVARLGPVARGIRADQHDIQRLQLVARGGQRGRHIAYADRLARRDMRQVQHHARPIAVLQRDPFRARSAGLDMPPGVEVGADMVPADDYAVVGRVA